MIMFLRILPPFSFPGGDSNENCINVNGDGNDTSIDINGDDIVIMTMMMILIVRTIMKMTMLMAMMTIGNGVEIDGDDRINNFNIDDIDGMVVRPLWTKLFFNFLNFFIEMLKR